MTRHALLVLCLAACSSDTPSTPATCGNGVVDSGEQCDDGNTSAGDGCDSACKSEGGVACGNGVLETGEACDDGNTTAGDGCSATCTAEPPPFDLQCPRFVDLPKYCVPLPGSGNQLMKVAASAACPAGYFPATGNADAFVVRELFADTILIKETNAQTGERPVMTLFLGQTAALLLDTGHIGEAIDDVVAPLVGTRGLQIINTHLHGDHINANSGLDTLAIDTPEVRTHCSLTDASFDASKSAPCPNTTPYDPPNAQTLGDPETFRVVRVVQDGATIDLGGRSITVLFTPGHSRTSITLRDIPKRALYTGDTLYPDDEIALIHPSGANLNEYLATAQRYAALEPMTDVVVGAHSQGTMPARVLGKFLAIVQDRVNGGTMTRVIDAACDAGGFRFQNFPP